MLSLRRDDQMKRVEWNLDKLTMEMQKCLFRLENGYYL